MAWFPHGVFQVDWNDDFDVFDGFRTIHQPREFFTAEQVFGILQNIIAHEAELTSDVTGRVSLAGDQDGWTLYHGGAVIADSDHVGNKFGIKRLPHFAKPAGRGSGPFE